ncbi:thymidylate synthase [Streptomonospora sp. PA3]|uniref:thymidylate synthase n=1 Tax=Streptomonospora sp. PA3 TaxID=2607326 RepID=UPI0012DE67D1|nr:thymidylate synthase [Streptomonospora sp. PA3]MUL41573.1 thymidylate synthase [Streptomonospora sp. PA3]
MFPATYATFQQLYTSVLHEIADAYEYTVAPRGNASREITDVTLRLRNPRSRLAFLKQRPVNIVFNVAEVLWYLAGRDGLDMIAYYAPRLRDYSPDGRRLAGTAYGPKLFAPDNDGSTQWARVMDLLRRDADTKRAVLTFFGPAELADAANPDVSCSVSAQFLLREGHLHLSVAMRGNDAYTGLVSDVFAFTFLQEFAAAQLGARLGHYTHHVVSMHVNDTDAHRMERIVDADRNGSITEAAFTPAAMPTNASWEDIATVLAQEEKLRANTAAHDPDSVTALGLAPYWQHIVLLLEAYRQLHHSSAPVSPYLLAALDPAHRWLVEHRWPQRMPTGTR